MPGKCVWVDAAAIDPLFHGFSLTSPVPESISCNICANILLFPLEPPAGVDPSGVPDQAIAFAKDGLGVNVETDAILGSAVYDLLNAHGATHTDVHTDPARATGWERFDPTNTLHGAEPAFEDNEATWEESSKVGMVAGAVTGAATGGGLGVVGGPIGALVGGVVGGVLGAATGAAADVAGELAKEALEDEDDTPSEG